MNDFLIYLLKTNGVFIVLYLVYLIFLNHLTFHRLNRAVLLSILPLSLIVPLMQIEINIGSIMPATQGPLNFEEFSQMNNAASPAVSESFQWNIGSIMMMLYIAGVVFFMIKYLLSFWQIIKIKHRSVRKKYGDFYICPTDFPSPFSVFNWIFLPENCRDTSIIEHEKLHCKAHHSLDLLCTEFFVVLLWFNPFVYLFRKSLKSVHEYRIDQMILKSDIKTSEYLQLILNHLEKSYKTPGFCNNFDGSTLKKRIKMMTKNNSSKWKSASYLILVPIIALMTMSFSNNNDKNSIPDTYPVEKNSITKINGYGEKIHPFTKKQYFHKGMDFAAKTGTPIMATASGTVTKVENLEDTFGKIVVINHGKGYVTRYAHLDDFAVKKGEKISKGKVIGYVGNTGLSTGPHVHYEVLKDGENVNPMDYVK